MMRNESSLRSSRRRVGNRAPPPHPSTNTPLLGYWQVVMTTGMFCWWSLAQRRPIRSWSYNRSVNRGGRTFSSCTMLRKDRRNPGPPTGNWQSWGGCQWAAMVRQYTNSGGRGYRGCQVGGLHHVWRCLSHDSLLLSTQSINAIFVFTVGMQLLNTSIKRTHTISDCVDVALGLLHLLTALSQIFTNHSCRWFLTNVPQLPELRQKAKTVSCKGGWNVMLR